MTNNPSHSNLHLVSYANMRFGEMIDNGYSYNVPDRYWTGQIENLDAKALVFYEPIINKYVVNYNYIYYPSDDNIDLWTILFNNALATAVMDQAPVLSLLSYPAVMPDQSEGSTGIMNIQEGGTEGKRAVDFNTEMPQSMLNGNIGDYGSDGNANSHKIVKYIPSLQAIKEFNDEKNPYKDAVHRIAEAVEKSGVFSTFIY